jgi:hypothetical protein
MTGTPMTGRPPTRRLLWPIVATSVLFLCIIAAIEFVVLRPGPPPQKLDAPAIAHELAIGNVDRLTIVGHRVSGELKKAIGDGARRFTATATNPATFVEVVLARNDGADVQVRSTVAQGDDADQARFYLIVGVVYAFGMSLALLVTGILRARRLS